jgi:TolA-binding protein
MESAEAKLIQAGRKIRGALDEEGNAGEELRSERKRLIDMVATRNLRGGRGFGVAAPGRRGMFAGFGLTIAAAAAVLVWLQLPISFRIAGGEQAGAAGVPGRTGDVVEAGDSAATALRFSEGSSITLDKGGRLRVLSTESNGARVLIESGGADVAIAHRGTRKGRWRFEAGPVAIQVTGTKFRVAWDPKERSFGLELTEGSVIVSGDCLPGPRTVTAGGTVKLSCLPAGVATTAVAPADAPAPAVEAKAVDGASVRAPIAARREAKLAQAQGGDESWQALVAAGHYVDGLRAAERVGFARVCRSADAVELLALADAARLSGRTARAVEALLVLRQRFPGSLNAATAAFALGRVAFERRSDYTEAARWFSTYLDEQPSGPLMGDAIGRLMEARHRGGERSAARRDAERYLQRFPEGPYAGTARAILFE